MHAQSHVALSADGVPIHYDVQGTGATALVFVHGWCCHRGHWDQQVDYFAPRYTVVCLDLPGHGTSGCDRTQWTIPAFGHDVVTVVEQLGGRQVVLIGHSMGGAVIVEAARRLPTTVLGLVSIDTWANLAHIRTPAEVAARLAPFRVHFAEAMRAHVPTLFVATSDPTVVEHVRATMAAVPPHIAISIAEEGWGGDRRLQEGLREVRVPKLAINARPTQREAAQRHGVEVVQLSGVGHFVMLEEPQTFNRLLDTAVQQWLHARARQEEQRRASGTV